MSKSEDRSGLDRASMERMSTSDLEELLRRDFHAPEGGETDLGGLYQAAQVLAGREQRSDAAVDRAWESFRENYLPFAKDGGSLYEDGCVPSSDAVQERRHSPSRRQWLRGLLAAAVLAAVLLSASVAGTAAGGYDLCGVRHAWWTDEEMGISPGRIECADRDDIRIPEGSSDYAGIGEALEDCGLTLPLAPQWVPEGFEMNFLGIDELMSDMLIFYAHYARGDENLVVEVNVYIEREDGGDRDYGRFQKDGGDPVPYEAGGVTHLLTTNAGRPTALWTHGPAECVVSGDITMEELKRVIDSIYG